MKKIILIIFVSAFLCVACQPTPEEAIVISKDKDLVAEVIEANEEENIEAMQESKEIIEEQIEAINEHLSFEVQVNDRVKIVVDADVEIPTYDKIPMVRVVPENFTQEHLQILVEQVFGDNSVYYIGESNWTKEEIEEILISLNVFLQNNALESNIQSHIESCISLLEGEIKNSLHIGEEEIYTNTSLLDEDFNMITDIKCYLNKNQAATINMTLTENKIGNQIWLRNQDYAVVYNTFEVYDGTDAEKIDLSYEACKQIAINLVQALDGTDTNMTLFSSGIGYSIGFFADYTKETSPQCYSFSFAREYNEVIVKPVSSFRNIDTLDYSSQISTESINIKIDNEGIWSVTWGDYTQYIDTIAEDTPLMDFDSIYEIFQDYCKYTFSWLPSGDGMPDDLTVTINIDKVELNLMMTPEKDDLESFILIPVWDFIGDIDYDVPYVGQDGYTYDGSKNVAVITINAIDGTIVDRNQGY